MNRAKHRRQERQKLEEQAFNDSLNPINIRDPDTGMSNKYFMANCPVCKEEQALIIDELIKNWYCGACEFGKVKSNEMKNGVKVLKKQKRMRDLYPDEQFDIFIKEIDENEHAKFEHIKALIHDFHDIANDLRSTLEYKAYPKSATDEHRLIAAFYLFSLKSEYKMNLYDKSRENRYRASNILLETIKQAAIEGRSSVV